MRLKKYKQGYLDISFGWMFALIVGGVILFLAIFAVTKITKTESSSLDIQASVQLDALTNPLETGGEAGSSNLISLSSETRIKINCDPGGDFGYTKLRVNQKVFNKWTESDSTISLRNKYIFSESLEEGKKFYFFTKPFDYPFKVASLTYLSSTDTSYCFINPPEEIKKELTIGTGQNAKYFQNNLRIKGDRERGECLKDATKVCFSGNCDIRVDLNSKKVKKKNHVVSFEGTALMFAAIFSTPKDYDCQAIRLAKKAGELISIYSEKSSSTACSTNLNLQGLKSNFESVKNSQDLISLSSEVKSISEENEGARCRLW